MNLSGEVVRRYVDYFKMKVEDILVIHDDLDQEIGKIKLKQNSSSGGHNGIKSVIRSLSTQNIARLKVGIGPQPPIPSEAFVLQNFTKDQLEALKPALKKSVEGIEYYFENGMQKTQNFYN